MDLSYENTLAQDPIELASGLLFLPNECILTVFSFLRTREIRQVALTFNNRLFALASPIVEQGLAKIRADEAHFESTFPHRYRDFTGWHKGKLSRYLEYLDLKSDLSWASKPAETRVGQFSQYQAHYDAMTFDSTVSNLFALGLSPPRPFLQMIYQLRWYQFFVNPSRISCQDIAKILTLSPSETYPSGLPAYVLTFYREHHKLGWFHLYLDTAGRHAVLTSENRCAVHDAAEAGYEEAEYLELSAVEKELGVLPARVDFCEKFAVLEDINFERWLKLWAPIPGGKA